MMVVPLVVASMVTGIAKLGHISKLGSLGGRTLAYYMATTGVAVIIGIILVNIIQPGKGIVRIEDYHPQAHYTIKARPIAGGSVLILGNDSHFNKTDYSSRFEIKLLDQGIRGTIDEESRASDKSIPVSEWLNAQGKKVEPDTIGTGVDIKLKSKSFSFIDVLIGLIPKNLFDAMASNNILPLIVFSLLFGAILTTLGAAGQTVINLFDGLNEAFLKIIRVLMYFAPLGILGLVGARLGKAELATAGGFGAEIARMGKYFITVVIGLLIHSLFILLPAIYIFARRNIGKYVSNISPALLTAFSTSSSSATLPMTLECVEEKNKVSNRAAGFVLPLGATINMDGTALYEAVAAIFIAQVYGIHLTFVSQIIVFLTATLAAIGAAGIPEAGLVTMVIVLNAVGLPTEGIAMILAIDWFLDRCRTTVNVLGDAVGAAVIDRWEGTGS